ncbi:hypothetical protein [Planococcus koreensis]|uniref:hypothetical protein n=1 Tax=Planococcus koreensis TaxID=112331 RepID=UPI0039FC5CD5
MPQTPSPRQLIIPMPEKDQRPHRVYDDVDNGCPNAERQNPIANAIRINLKNRAAEPNGYADGKSNQQPFPYLQKSLFAHELRL